MGEMFTENEEFEKINLFDESDSIITEIEHNCEEDLSSSSEKVESEGGVLQEVGNQEKTEEVIVIQEKQSQEEKNDSTTGMDYVINSVNDLSIKIDDMNKLFIRKIQHTEHEEKIVDQMHSELQKYKDDMYSQLVRPILLDIANVRDSILRMTKIYKDKPEGEQDIPNKIFADYALDIQDILEKNEIEIYQSTLGDAFIPVKQRAIKKVSTDNAELHGKIAESMSNGYIYKGRTISAEKVAVYYYEKSDNRVESEE